MEELALMSMRLLMRERSPKLELYRELISPVNDHAASGGGVEDATKATTPPTFKLVSDASHKAWSIALGCVQRLVALLRKYDRPISLNAPRLAMILFSLKVATMARPIVIAHLRAMMARLVLLISVKIARIRVIAQAMVKSLARPRLSTA